MFFGEIKIGTEKKLDPEKTWIQNNIASTRKVLNRKLYRRIWSA